MHFVAGAVTAHLLTSDNKPTIINNNYFVPLSESQANLYMTTQEYKDNLDIRCKAIFFYIDRNNHYQPRLIVNTETGEKRIISYYQAKILVEREKPLQKELDKTILMTKGIKSLPTEHVSRQVSLINKICTYIFCFPCAICDCVGGNECESDIVEVDDGSSRTLVNESAWKAILTV